MKVKKNTLKIFILLILLLLLIFNIIPKNSVNVLSIKLIMLFCLIGTLTLEKIIKEIKKVAYSLNMMHWIFVLFFFCVIPIVQITFNFNSWGIKHSSQEIARGCMFVIIWIIGYIIGNTLGSKVINKNKIIKMEDHITEVSKIFLILLTIISLVSLGILIKNIGLSNMFARSTANVNYSGENSKMMTLLINNCTRVCIVYSTALSFMLFQRNKGNLLILLTNIACLLIACFPTATARNTAATVYIGFFIIGFYKNIEKYRKSLKFIVVFILAFIIVFPAINTFRIHKFSDVKIMNVMANVTKDITKNYLSEDYDAFSIVIDTDKYVKDNGISSGKQFLGAMLFFIPRNIWKNKPFGSGQTMFMVFKQKFTNISCPLLAEGYINFGIVGIILFAIITGFIIEIVDRKYWGNVDKNGITYDYLTILYPFLLGGYFFMLRGDLMSTWGYMFVYIFIFYILNKIQKKKCD